MRQPVEHKSYYQRARLGEARAATYLGWKNFVFCLFKKLSLAAAIRVHEKLECHCFLFAVIVWSCTLAFVVVLGDVVLVCLLLCNCTTL